MPKQGNVQVMETSEKVLSLRVLEGSFFVAGGCWCLDSLGLLWNWRGHCELCYKFPKLNSWKNKCLMNFNTSFSPTFTHSKSLKSSSWECRDNKCISLPWPLPIEILLTLIKAELRPSSQKGSNKISVN